DAGDEKDGSRNKDGGRARDGMREQQPAKDKGDINGNAPHQSRWLLMPAVFAWSGNNSETVRAGSNQIRKDQAQHRSDRHTCSKLHTFFFPFGDRVEAGSQGLFDKAAIPTIVVGCSVICFSM